MRDTEYMALAGYLDDVHQRMTAALSAIAWQPPGDGPGALALHQAARDVVADLLNVQRRLRVMDDIGRAMADGMRPAYQRDYLISQLADTIPGAWAGGRAPLDEAREYVRKLQAHQQGADNG